MFHLTLFGAPSLQGPQGPVVGRAVQRRRIALLAVLALARAGAVTRDRLIGLLWPEAEAERARHLLSDSVYLLRRAVGEGAVLSAGDDLRLDPRVVRCDVAEFEMALEAGEWARAAGLYTGPLLEGFFVEDAPEFERWAENERDRLARGYALALESLAESASGMGEWTRAVDALRRLSRHDRYNGRVALALMRALDASGDRAGAIRHAQTHALLLRHELEAEPDAEVEALATRLRGEPVRRPDADAAAAPLPAAGLPAASGSDPAPPPQPAVPDARQPRRPLGPARVARPFALGGMLALALLALLAGSGQAPGLLGSLRFQRSGSSLDPPAAASLSVQPTDRSLAVLPFADLSGGESADYFSDGFTEEVIATLATIGDLRVTSRTSVMNYRNVQKSLPEIARELGVAHVLEGSIRRSGDRLRITAQLIDARSDTHLWARSYERELSTETLFQIQADIAQHIAGALRAEVSPAGRERLQRLPTADLAAYDLYLRGREARRSHRLADLRLSISLFEHALRLDPHFALAEAYRGESYGYLWRYTRQPEYRDSAYASHQRVLRLAPELPEGHQLLARHYDSIGRRGEALRLFRRALELNPNHPGTLHDLASIHQKRGELDQALPYARKAVSVEPTSFLYSWEVFMLHVRLGDFAEAEQWLGQVLALEATRLRELHGRVVLSLVRGEPERARQHLEAIRQHEGEEPSRMLAAADYALYLGDLEVARSEYERLRAAFPARSESVLTGPAYILWKTGERQSAQTMLEHAIRNAHRRLEEGDESPDPHLSLARSYAIRGEVESALESLETAHARGWRGYHAFARVDPRFDNLRGHPRFERLMAAMRADLDRMRQRAQQAR